MARRLKYMSFWDEIVEEIKMEFKLLQENFITATLATEGTLTKKANEFRRFVTAMDAKVRFRTVI